MFTLAALYVRDGILLDGGTWLGAAPQCGSLLPVHRLITRPWVPAGLLLQLRKARQQRELEVRAAVRRFRTQP